MAERSKAHAWKACIRETVSWVRIPLPPPAAISEAIRRRPKRPKKVLNYKGLSSILRVDKRVSVQRYPCTKRGLIRGRRASRQIGRVTAIGVSRAKSSGMYPGGGGLYLQVGAIGTRSWIFRFTLNGRERAMGLGPLHDLTLGEAREKAAQCRRLKRDGIDPIDARNGDPSRKVSQSVDRAAEDRNLVGSWLDAKRDPIHVNYSLLESTTGIPLQVGSLLEAGSYLGVITHATASSVGIYHLPSFRSGCAQDC